MSRSRSRRWTSGSSESFNLSRKTFPSPPSSTNPSSGSVDGRDRIVANYYLRYTSRRFVVHRQWRLLFIVHHIAVAVTACSYSGTVRSRLHWRVTLQLYIDGYTAKRKRENRERESTRVHARFRSCVRRNAKWTRHAAGRGLSRGSPTFFFLSFFSFFLFIGEGEGVLLDDSFNFLGPSLYFSSLFVDRVFLGFEWKSKSGG